MSKQVDLAAARRNLAILWLLFGAALVVILVMQTLGDKYGTQAAKAWGWLLPNIVPTLASILATIVYQARYHSKAERVDRFAYMVSIGVSGFYLVLVVAMILVEPFVSGRRPLEWLQLSQLWLGPMQGLVAIMLGMFFQSAEGGKAEH